MYLPFSVCVPLGALGVLWCVGIHCSLVSGFVQLQHRGMKGEQIPGELQCPGCCIAGIVSCNKSSINRMAQGNVTENYYPVHRNYPLMVTVTISRPQLFQSPGQVEFCEARTFGWQWPRCCPCFGLASSVTDSPHPSHQNQPDSWFLRLTPWAAEVVRVCLIPTAGGMEIALAELLRNL